MDQKNYKLRIRENIRYNPEHIILVLLHEYGHAISQKRFKTADYRTSEQELIEEGMADTFADIVARSFDKITINGQEINLHEATMLNYSDYKNHNNVVRTMLYPLKEAGQDKEAIFNYYFDNKLKFFELTLGTDYIKKLPTDFNKNPNYVEFSWNEIYNNHKDGYKEIDYNSVYAINNEKLNEFSRRYNTEVEKEEQDPHKVQNNIKEIAEIKDELVDYYDLYGIGTSEKWGTIQEKLKKELKKWILRANATSKKETLDEVFQHIDEISDALELFKPKNEEKRKQYDAQLEQQKRRKVISGNAKEKMINRNNKIESIVASIKNNPTGLEYLKEIKQQRTRQIKDRESNKDFYASNLKQMDDNER